MPYTQEAISASDAKDRRCYACTYEYGKVLSHTNQTEPAVRTSCGHVHGVVCLELKAGRSKCPLCRRNLFGIEQRLTWKGREAYTRLMQVSRAIAKYDEEVDAYLLEGRKKVHEQAFGRLLKKLAKLVDSMAGAKNELWYSLSE
jgi:hypothetical protein